MPKYYLAALCSVFAGGCASIIDGTTQEMTFNSAPPGAQCTLHRDGKEFSRLTTPNTVVVKKTKHDIRIECEKEGYEPVVHMVKSEIQGSAWGNIILGGGIGWAIDSASGADNKYQEYINITLTPAGNIKVQEQGSPAPMSQESIVDAPESEDDEGDAASPEAGEEEPCC